MQPFQTLDAVALPIPRANLDTDQIIPARFLRKPRAGGFGQFLFHDLRFRPRRNRGPLVPAEPGRLSRRGDRGRC